MPGTASRILRRLSQGHRARGSAYCDGEAVFVVIAADPIPIGSSARPRSALTGAKTGQFLRHCLYRFERKGLPPTVCHQRLINLC